MSLCFSSEFLSYSVVAITRISCMLAGCRYLLAKSNGSFSALTFGIIQSPKIILRYIAEQDYILYYYYY
jgi:hypothetical protein